MTDTVRAEITALEQNLEELKDESRKIENARAQNQLALRQAHSDLAERRAALTYLDREPRDRETLERELARLRGKLVASSPKSPTVENVRGALSRLDLMPTIASRLDRVRSLIGQLDDAYRLDREEWDRREAAFAGRG